MTTATRVAVDTVSPRDRRRKVAEYLTAWRGHWIPGYDIASPEVGGSEGLRRLRELRAKGWPIIKRKKTDSTAYEYLLLNILPPQK